MNQRTGDRRRVVVCVKKNKINNTKFFFWTAADRMQRMTQPGTNWHIYTVLYGVRRNGKPGFGGKKKGERNGKTAFVNFILFKGNIEVQNCRRAYYLN